MTGIRAEGPSMSRWRAVLAVVLLAAVGLAGCTSDRAGQPQATDTPVEASQSHLAREWLRTAAAGDESRLRELSYQASDPESGEIAAVLGLMGELGELQDIEIGRSVGPETAGDTRSTVVCTRLTASDGQQVDGGVRLVEDDGRWVPQEWLQFVGCQDDQGDYGAA